MIGTEPATDAGGVRTVAPAHDLWPHNITDWQYYTSGEGWHSDPLMNVTGNINVGGSWDQKQQSKVNVDRCYKKMTETVQISTLLND